MAGGGESRQGAEGGSGEEDGHEKQPGSKEAVLERAWRAPGPRVHLEGEGHEENGSRTLQGLAQGHPPVERGMAELVLGIQFSHF